MRSARSHVLDLSQAGADPRTLPPCDRVEVTAIGVDPDATDAALRVLREASRLKALRFVSDQPLLPLAVTELSTLQHLEIINPELPGLPHEIGDLERLRTLKLTAFQLGSLPRSIGSLQRLRKLSVDAHQLRRLPPQLADLAELRDLRLFFRGHFIPKKWGDRPYFRARIEQTLPEVFQLLSQLPHLSSLTLGEPPRGWFIPNPILREIPPEIGLLESLQTLRLVGCQEDVRLPLEVPALARLRDLIAIDTRLGHSEAELRGALPHTRIRERRRSREFVERVFREHLDREGPAAKLLEGTRQILRMAWGNAVLVEEISLALAWLLHEGGDHGAAIDAARACERAATTVRDEVFARLLQADASLSAQPSSPDTALAVLDLLAPIPLDGLPDVLVAWHWLISATAFRRLGQPEAEREAMQQARRVLGPVEPTASPLLLRLRGWLAP
jgi:hypothetical protein